MPRFTFSGRERRPVGPKDVILCSFMAHMINPGKVIVVLAFVLVTLTGCSSLFGDPREEANESIARANESIAEHNRLFERARDTYAEVKENIESGDAPAEQAEEITAAREAMQEARGHLQEAQSTLSEVEDLEVEETVRRYAGLLSNAMDRQLEAEAKEIEFYEILEEDPALEERRDEALDLLSEVGENYTAAEQEYEQAQELANSNPDLLSPGPQPGQGEQTPQAPEEGGG